MGLLDNLGNLSPEQTQGLLGFASSMLQAGGPSLKPTSFGQALGGGLTAFNTTMNAERQRKLEEDQLRQIAEMRGLQIQGMAGDLQDKALGRQQQLDAQKWRREYNVQRSTPTGIAQSVLGSNLSPTVDNAAALSAYRQAMPDGIGDAMGGNTMAQFNSRLAEAQAMRASGNPYLIQNADALEKTALEFRPKVKSWEKVSVDGRVLLKPYFEDGTAGSPVGADVAEKLQFQNLGGKTVGLNPYTGAQVSTYQNSMSPDAVASNNIARDRFNFDKEQAGRPVFSEQAGGFVSRPTAANPAGSLIPLQGFTPKQPQAPVEFSKSAAGLVELQSALNNYQSVIDEIGGTRVSPTSNNGAKLKAAFTGVQMGLKNAMELGALAGPDVEILGGMLVDPTSVKGLMYGASGVSQQIGQTRKYLDNRTQAVEKVFGRKVPAPAPQQAEPLRKSAIKGQVLNGYRFKGGDPADESNWEKI